MAIRPLVRSFANWFTSEVNAIKVDLERFEQRRIEIVDDYVTQRALYVAALDALTQDERQRISPYIEAHVAVCAKKKATSQAIRGILGDHKACVWTMAGPFLAAALLGPLLAFLAMPNVPTAIYRVITLSAIALSVRKIQRILAPRTTYATPLSACVLMLCMLSVKGAHSAWPGATEAAIRLPASTGWTSWDSSVTQIDEVQSLDRAFNLLLLITCAAIAYGGARLYLALYGDAFILGEEHHSVIIDELLKINQLLHVAETTGTPSGSAIETRDLYLRMYLQSDIINRLQSLARIFEGPWRRSMHIGDKATDTKIDIMADGLATAARNWMLRVQTEGLYSSDAAKQAFASALIDSVDGNWRAMVVEESTPRTRWKKKVTRSLRTMTAIAIIIAMIAFLKGSIPGIPVALQGTELQFPIAILATLLAATVDPHASERISAATRIIGETQGKKKE